jgi:hypothetical protein
MIEPESEVSVPILQRKIRLKKKLSQSATTKVFNKDILLEFA